MFHQFEIKDDELLPYTEENDFINGTLFHAWTYSKHNVIKVRNIYFFFKMDILEGNMHLILKKNNFGTSQKPQNA